MKRLYTLFAILIALCSFLPAAEAENAEAENVDIPDDSLARSLRRALGLARNAPIPKAELATLTELDVRPKSNITDITGLEHATALTSLNLYRNGIGDITLLAGLTNLTYLNIRYTSIEDISPLSGLTSLERLDLSMNYIENLEVLSNLTALKALTLIENTAFFQTPQGLQDISFLSALTALEYLDLQVNHITDITPLAGLTQLETLLLGNNPSLSDISTLSGLTTLKHLYLNSTSISDISPLSGLTALKILYIPRASISDISPLSGLTGLKHLHLRLNSINDISPLSSLTSLELLDLRQNPITDVTPLQALTALRVLCLKLNPELTDLQPLHTLRSAVEAQGITVLDGSADVSGAPEAVQKIIRRLREGNLAIDAVEPVAEYLLIDVDIGEAVAEAQHVNLNLSLDGHTGTVNALAFSPDGTKLASASSDKTVRLWNPAVGELLHSLAGYHQSAVTSVAFSPDGTTLVSGDREDRTLRFWDISTGQLVQTRNKYRQAVETIAWSSHGLASAGGKTVRIWHRTQDVKPSIFRGHESVVTAVAWSPDGTTLVSGARDTKTLRFWNASTGDLIQTRNRYRQAVEAIAWSPHGLASAGGLTVRIWHPTQDVKPAIFRGHTNRVYSVAWHPDGDMLASGSADSRVILWDTDGNILATMYEHTGAVHAVAWSPDGQKVASAGAGGQVLVWSVSAVIGAAPAASVFTPPIAPTEAALHPNYPNPFNPETWIPYQLATPAEVSLSIYAADGRLVRTLQLGHQPAGAYLSRGRAAYWDGRNAQGEPVASGVYFYTLKAGEFAATRKMLIRK